MAPKFGTSGLRGLVTELTADLVADHVRAFLQACPMGAGLWLGRDLRGSSPDLASVVAETALSCGVPVVDCGALPTPALALAAFQGGGAAIMVTGSHIPADRNGLKFYTPAGEITKADEAAILGNLGACPPEGPRAALTHDAGAAKAWVARYVSAFGPGYLAGLRLGLWSHSTVARDLMADALRQTGAHVTELGRTDHFLPIDTEAVSEADRGQIAAWVAEHRLDALVSTDGDGDRPLLADAAGQVVPGDVLGQITAAVLGAETVVTPVSSNSGAEAGGRFARVIRTRIGSPYVIAAMAVGGRVVGYEANGGFLLGFEAAGPAGPLPALITRDSLLPVVASLGAARAAEGLAARVAQEVPRFTASDRLEHVPTERSLALVQTMLDAPAQLAALMAELGETPADQDLTDGLRLTLASGRILHMRPSGNAPEFRLYAEAESRAMAESLLRRGLALLSGRLRDQPLAP